MKRNMLNRIRFIQCGILLSLLSLLGLSVHLALHRIFQVDEAQNLFMIRMLATHQSDLYFTNALLWMLGPMSWLVGTLTESVKIFDWARLLFLGVYLLNIVLLALNVGRKMMSYPGLLALFGAATLAPLWDYGFEVRHDNLILTGLLLMWWLGRVSPLGRWSYFGLGFLSILMPFVSFKAIAYSAPLSLVFLLFPPPGHKVHQSILVKTWILGTIASAAAVVMAYQFSSAGPVFLAGIKAGLTSGTNVIRFDPIIALDRLPLQIPLIEGLAVLAVAWVLIKVLSDQKEAFTWDGLLPEALLCLGSFALLLINPTPYPYNLVNLVPFAYLLAFRFAAPFVEFKYENHQFQTRLLGLMFFLHITPFILAMPRHLEYTNDRQKILIQTAEAMTDPRMDRVYDAVGMLPTRASIGFNWYNHSLNRAAFANGTIPSVSAMLTEHPASVIIRSYRTEMMSNSDKEFIRTHYIAIADDFWVLGRTLALGGGDYTVSHSGRYMVQQFDRGRFLPLRDALMAGKPISEEPIELNLGTVQIQCAPNVQPAVVWIGPSLKTLPVLGKGNHSNLFRNFY
ncbi:hypothetical protein [Undibacterium sp. Ren11W]|uniref:hypothetical protein n=1 Tax=Undibacterium sp. Ren11W TaxID=3413045 RepID=UPI003BF0562F